MAGVTNIPTHFTYKKTVIRTT